MGGLKGGKCDWVSGGLSGGAEWHDFRGPVGRRSAQNDKP